MRQLGSASDHPKWQRLRNGRAGSKRAGQASLEYAVLIGVVIGAFVAMQIYARRGIQAGVKTAVDRLSPFGAEDPTGARAQAQGALYETGGRDNLAVDAGDLLERQASAKTTVTRRVREEELDGGGRVRTVQQDDASTSGALAGGAASRTEVVAEIRR